MIGILIGAGFSKEAGMPLITDVDQELKKWLTPAKLIQFNNHWSENGLGFHPEVINEFCGVLINPEMHYEKLAGWLENREGRQPDPKKHQDFYGLRQWLLEMIGWIFYYRHVLNFNYISGSIPFIGAYINW